MGNYNWLMAAPRLRRKNGVRAEKPRNRLPVAKKHARELLRFEAFHGFGRFAA
jgi:hypothetical protein